MAMAHLAVSARLCAALAAHKAGYLLISVDGVVGAVDCDGEHAAGSKEATFAALVAAAAAAPAQARLFAVGDDDGRWVLVSFVPEGVHPRTKMSIAAAKDAIKKACKGAPFGAEYHATGPEELTLAAYQSWADRSDRAGAMSALERQMAAARVDEEAERQRQMAGARPGLPSMPGAGARPPGGAMHMAAAGSGHVMLSPEACAALGALADGGVVALRLGAPGVVELVSRHQAAAAEGADVVGDGGAAAAALAAVGASATEPRLVVVRVRRSADVGGAGGGGSVTGLLCHVPEGSAPRARVAYSSAKAAVAAAAATQAHCAIGRTVETSDGDDVQAAVGELLLHAAPPTAAGGAHPASPASAAVPSPTGSSGSGGSDRAAILARMGGGVALPMAGLAGRVASPP